MFYFDATGIRNEIGVHEHYHSAMEFYLLTKGHCTYLVGDKLYEMDEGDLVCVPQGTIHKAFYYGAHARMLINCTDQFVRDLPMPEFPVFRNPDAKKEIYAVFGKIQNEYLRDDRFSPILLTGYMHQLLAVMGRNRNCYINQRPTDSHIDRILDYLHKNYCGDVSLSAAAREAGITEAHLSRMFKKETGQNFSEYLSQLRLKKAEGMLRYDNQSISEIALACGFNDSNYFSEKFKRVYHMSPLKYKKFSRSKAAIQTKPQGEII